MSKNIDLEDASLFKLKVLSSFENKSVKCLIEEAVQFYVSSKEKERIDSLSPDEKDDLGLLLLMQQADARVTVSRFKVMKELDK